MELCSLAHDKLPNLVFLMETKINSIKVEVIKWKPGFYRYFSMDVAGRRGGLTLFWKFENHVQIHTFP